MMLLKLRCLMMVALLSFSGMAAATASSPNFSDLWWNPNESGWGLNVTQQADVMFVTLFVYDTDSLPTWFSGVLASQGSSADGSTVFVGDLNETSGPWFGTAFNRQVTGRNVGTATFRAGNLSNFASLQYSVDGVLVSKQIQRQTLRSNDLAGTYLGATSDVTFGCSNGSRNNLRTEDPGPFNVVQVADSITIFAPTCTYRGTYFQQGQTGRINAGSYTCTNGAQGVISFSDLYVEQSGIVGKYSGQDSACSFRGSIGGARRP